MSTTLSDIVRATAEATGSTQVATREVLEIALEFIGEQLNAGESVVLTGLGRLQPRVKPARAARNPNNGEPVAVPAKRVVKFIPRGQLAQQLLEVPEVATAE